MTKRVFRKDGKNYREGDKVRGTFNSTAIGTENALKVVVTGHIKFVEYRCKFYLDAPAGLFALSVFEKMEKLPCD